MRVAAGLLEERLGRTVRQACPGPVLDRVDPSLDRLTGALPEPIDAALKLVTRFVHRHSSVSRSARAASVPARFEAGSHARNESSRPGSDDHRPATRIVRPTRRRGIVRAREGNLLGLYESGLVQMYETRPVRWARSATATRLARRTRS